MATRSSLEDGATHSQSSEKAWGKQSMLSHRFVAKIKLFTQATFIFLFQTPDILSDWEFRTFWIRTESADPQFTISVGRGGETAPFMSHTFDYQKHDINFVAFSSYYGHSGEWYILPHHFEITTQEYSYQYYSTSALSPTRGTI